jgi:glutamyl-tRNA(Gln) amidotransferase subunit E
MYPETDIPEIVVDDARRKRLAKQVPEPWEMTISKLQASHALSRELAAKLYDSGILEEFERLVGELRNTEPSVIASALVDLPARTARELKLSDTEEGFTVDVPSVLRVIDRGAVAKEAAYDIMKLMASGQATSAEEAIAKLNLKLMSSDELDAIIDQIAREESELIQKKGERAFSSLMGEVMKRARGRADGQLVSELLRKKLADLRNTNHDQT